MRDHGFARAAFAWSGAALAAGLAGQAVAAGRRVTAIASVRAEIVRPLQAIALSPLSFGWVQAGLPGTVTVSPRGEVTLAGGAKLMKGDPAGPAQFQIRGEPGLFYRVNIPASVQAVRRAGPPAGPATLAAGDFRAWSQTAAATGLVGRLDRLGADTLTIGGTVHAPGGTPPGWYTITLPVTVAYE